MQKRYYLVNFFFTNKTQTKLYITKEDLEYIWKQQKEDDHEKDYMSVMHSEGNAFYLHCEIDKITHSDEPVK